MKRVKQQQYLTLLGFKRFKLSLKRHLKKKKLLKSKILAYTILNRELGYDFSMEKIYEKFLPSNIKFLIEHESLRRILSKKYPNCKGTFKVPKCFSLIRKPQESYELIFHILQSLVNQKYRNIVIDYADCEEIDIDAQIFLDVILLHFINFLKDCQSKNINIPINKIGGNNFKNLEIKKILFSVGSNAIHRNEQIRYRDIIPYNLCVRNREKSYLSISNSEQKDIDTTRMADYVLECLSRMKKTLTPEKLDNLCTVIGEILINAEEHSTTKYRYSVGYFKENNENGKHTGVFHLVIFNLGETIYEKFKNPNCPTQHIVDKMRNLSSNYTKRNLFQWGKFEEETLWTLYALQDGVTSKTNYQRRGNGSIQFIESFFSIKGIKKDFDDVSKMNILSGNTLITFDGTYNISEKISDGDIFKVMTFNKSGNIDDSPDKKFVKYVDHYFPGTMISAKILLNDDDLIENN